MTRKGYVKKKYDYYVMAQRKTTEGKQENREY
jgi:hypothetical protein